MSADSHNSLSCTCINSVVLISLEHLDKCNPLTPMFFWHSGEYYKNREGTISRYA